MMTNLPRRLLALALPLLCAAPAAAQQADTWPSRPVDMLIGFPNSSGVGIYARKLADPLSPRPRPAGGGGQPRSGAGGNVASDFVAKARPDGYLFLFGTAGTHAINPTLYRRLPFDVLRDFTPSSCSATCRTSCSTSLERRPQYRTCMDVIAAARARPGALNYGSTGNGASTHLAGARFATAAGLDAGARALRGQPGVDHGAARRASRPFFNQTGPAIGR